MFKWMKESAVTVKQAGEMSAEELEGKFIRGIHVERDQPEFIEVYDKLAEALAADSSAVKVDRAAMAAGLGGVGRFT